jgi:hypothetical protein
MLRCLKRPSLDQALPVWEHIFVSKPTSDHQDLLQVVIRADMMIPYPHTKAWGQVPCEDVAMRIPLPECWIYQVLIL